MMIQKDGHKVILRDSKPCDLHDYVRWFTTDVAWMAWDAPWEDTVYTEEDVIGKYARILARQASLKANERRSRYEIATKDGYHIGWVNTYQMSFSDIPKHKLSGRLAIGIDLPEEKHQGCGYGTSALMMMVDVLKSSGEKTVYLQTWRGNQRMIALAKKLGFTLRDCIKDSRIIAGKPSDALTFGLDLSSFVMGR